jgi:serine/tyrosine/threonine adenylyltransferase
MNLNISDTFNLLLPADPNEVNVPRQVSGACFSFVTPKKPTAPSLVVTAPEVAELLGIQEKDLASDDFLQVFSGEKVLEGTRPYAMCYGGHQFGSWAGQLGDGRAINLTEVLHKGRRWMLQLKGAGPTPYSRRGDGFAVLRSSIREFLCSEAIHYLGVPTTRALSLVLTGDMVLRDMLYDGNAAYEKGAIVCRVAPTFIRFGNFQIFMARQDIQTLRQLTDYTITHFYPEIGPPSKEAYLEFFKTIVARTLDMVLHWQRIGFVHGVMNTDNMSILGDTIDYGPYGWIDNYDPDWTPNTTDAEGRRYRFGQQPQIAHWNLAQLANALYPLIGETEPLIEVLKKFPIQYEEKYLNMMRHKLGLLQPDDTDATLIEVLEHLLTQTETDMTLFFRLLAKHNKANTNGEVLLQELHGAFYQPDDLHGELKENWIAWLSQYTQRLQWESAEDIQRRTAMDAVNPKYVLRNYMAQMAIDQAEIGDYSLIHELQALLKQPYAEQPDQEKWFAKRPDWARVKVGCSMLSCSS